MSPEGYSRPASDPNRHFVLSHCSDYPPHPHLAEAYPNRGSASFQNAVQQNSRIYPSTPGFVDMRAPSKASFRKVSLGMMWPRLGSQNFPYIDLKVFADEGIAGIFPLENCQDLYLRERCCVLAVETLEPLSQCEPRSLGIWGNDL